MFEYKILDKINSPSDIKSLSNEEMLLLASEIRHFLIENVTENGGHLASNLGVVELTLAIHKIFDSPNDKIIFDVGHQSYVHKILTGRRDGFSSLRKPGGLSGFTKRSESEHDPFGTGHSSTAISAALGFAHANKLAGKDNYTIAIVGDGAFTGGMVYEALNNCSPDLKLIIILNENEMSISKNIGGFARYIAKIRSSKKYYKAKNKTRKIISAIPFIGKSLFNLMKNIKQRCKNFLFSSNFFEEIGLYYLGPVDGNDFARMERLLNEAKESKVASIIHVKTEKGKGYLPAEKHPSKYHSVLPKCTEACKNFSAAFGELIVEKARADRRICAITAAMSQGTGLSKFKYEFPDRFFDVGIAEEHALTFAAGLSAAGLKPVFAVYSTFLQRSYDNILHDAALQSLPVTVCVDRAGLAVSDGPTHHGIFDVAFLSNIPNIKIYCPIDFEALDLALTESLESKRESCFIRYPNSCESKKAKLLKKAGTSAFIRLSYDDIDSLDCIIITYGNIFEEAAAAAGELEKENIKAGIILLEKLKPYDETANDFLPYIFEKDGKIIFLEEGIKAGGAGMMFYETLRCHPKMQNKEYKILAIDDNFAIQTKDEPIYKTCGISAEDIIKAIKE